MSAPYGTPAKTGRVPVISALALASAATSGSSGAVSALSTALFAGLAGGMLLAGVLSGSESRRRATLRVGAGVALVLLVVVLWVSPRASFEELLPLMLGLGAALGVGALSFAVAVDGIPTHQSGTVVAIVNAAGCLGGAVLQELPIWLGGGEDSFRAMYIVYVAVAVEGFALTFALPRKPA